MPCVRAAAGRYVSSPAPHAAQLVMNGWRLPNWAGPALALGSGAALALAERRSPLRPRLEPCGLHLARNAVIAALGGLALALTEAPAAMWVAARVERDRIGILPRLNLPWPAETAIALLALDYTLYVWHRATHRAPFLWRFHQVHHVDRDCSASTALRFHFGELALSAFWRAAQLAVIGVDRNRYALWQALLVPSILFHHSDLALPASVDRILRSFIVTPRLHQSHHATTRALTDANWSSGLTIWDRLHRTYRVDIDPQTLDIGLPAYRRDVDVALAVVLSLPFAPQRDAFAPQA